MAGDGALESFVRRVINRINDLTRARVAGVDDSVARAAAAHVDLLVRGRAMEFILGVVDGVPPVKKVGADCVLASVPP